MHSNQRLATAVRRALGVTTGVVAIGAAPLIHAQDDAETLEEITVTGTRVTVPGVVSSSPIYSVGQDEIQLQAQPEVERVLRLLPITKPTDGQNVNNDTDGAATVDLRGLGEERNLVLIDGKRATPYSIEGVVDMQSIPTALIERIDIVTGGASAVYGSDAIAGALNFVMRKDFEGVDLRFNHTVTGEDDGVIQSAALVMGANMADGNGNVVVSLDWADRELVLFNARPLGQLGIDTASGANYDRFLAGDVPAPAPAGCGGPGSVAEGGSTTTVPTRVAIAGGPGLGQFRDDGTLASNCSVFNFNPQNQYQTPQQRWGGMVMARLDVNDSVEAYSSFRYSSINVRQQVAPSGIFGDNYFTPMANPLMSDSARNDILAAAEAGRLDNTVCADPTCGGADPEGASFVNWIDVNENGVVDAADELNISYRRRTVEFGNRTESYDANMFQITTGVRGSVLGDWEYDVSLQRGESDRTLISLGYTNVDAIESSIRSLDGVTCDNGDTACVPIDLFGGFGSITPEMAAANSASAIEEENYKQTIATASIAGAIDPLQLPTADAPMAVSLGVEYREEVGSTTPDECWKLSPTSCLGGAGGNRLPVTGRFDVNEVFFEGFVPLLADLPLVQDLTLEVGWRYSDYSHVGSNDTWKAGLSWRPTDSLLLRAMLQEATRAPNVAEIGSPVTSGLEDALIDPCSVANAGNIDQRLNDLCLSTGMSQAQVGTVEDIVSGQINNFEGTNPDVLPGPETADTLTLGFVWTPDFDFAPGFTLSVDYYDIEIEDVIGELSAQEILDGCYVAGLANVCEAVNRVGGTLTLPGSGTNAFTQNLDFLRAEGIEATANLTLSAGNLGEFDISGTVNHYLTQESLSASFLSVTECIGFYGNTCGNPLPETRWIQRTSWVPNDRFVVSYLWRHIGSTDIEPAQAAGTFSAFRSIDSVNYIDLTGTWQVTDEIGLNVAIYNIFDEDPPVVGNEAGTTASNSGNTFPSVYDTLGTIYTAGFNVRF